MGRDRTGPRLPNPLQDFRSKLEAETWAARTEAAADGRTLALGHQITLAARRDGSVVSTRIASFSPSAVSSAMVASLWSGSWLSRNYH